MLQTGNPGFYSSFEETLDDLRKYTVKLQLPQIQQSHSPYTFVMKMRSSLYIQEEIRRSLVVLSKQLDASTEYCIFQAVFE